MNTIDSTMDRARYDELEEDKEAIGRLPGDGERETTSPRGVEVHPGPYLDQDEEVVNLVNIHVSVSLNLYPFSERVHKHC